MANYQIQKGALIDDFDSLTEWTISGTAELDSTYFKTGTNSIKLTSPVGGNSNITKTVNLTLNQNNVMGFWVYLPDISKVADFSLYLSNDSGFVNYFYGGITNSNTRIYNGWNYIIIRKADWSAFGAATWEFPMVRLRARVTAASGEVAVAYFDSLYLNPYARPKCLMTFDDVPVSSYTEGFTYMNARGLKGTFFVTGSLTETGPYVNLAQLKDIYSKGWDVANHTWTHPHLDQISESEIRTELTTNEEWLARNGFERARRHVAYPYGGYNDTVLQVAQSMGIKTSRSTDVNSRYYQHHSGGLFNQNALKIGGTTSTVTLATAKDRVDRAIQIGGTIIFVFHSFAATATIQTEWPTADFRALVDYLLSKKEQIDVVTVSEWYNGLTNPRKLA